MKKTLKNKVEHIFCTAIEIESPEVRKAFLDDACQGDVALRALVDKMISWQPEMAKFFPEGGVPFILTEELFNISQNTFGPFNSS